MRNPQSPHLKAWMRAATTEQQEELAARVGTSRQYLYHLSGGFRQVQTDVASRLEVVTADMSKETNGALPGIYRTDVCEVCRQCPFAKAALGDAVVRADFENIQE